ncbi:MAG TPA: AraC family transcriptional regulator [Opitutaceae bacterium]|jgi:AraC-like DNA-binding protein
MQGQTVNIRVNRAAVVKCEPEWSWHPAPENFKDFDFWLVWAGTGEFRSGEVTLSLKSGSALCLRPHLNFHVTHNPKRRLGVGYVHFDFVDSSGNVVLPRETDLPPLFGRFTKAPFYEDVVRHIAELVRSEKEHSRSRAAEYLSLVLDDFRLESMSGGPSGLALEHLDRVEKVIRHVRENPGQIHSVADLSKLACYSPDYFTRIFSQVSGASPKEFCIQVRLERAKQLLGESKMSVDQVASALGYADPFFFSRQFSQRLGVSPRKWRQELALGPNR